MCGIYASVCTKSLLNPSHVLKQQLCNRGPDHIGQENVLFGSPVSPYHLSFTSTVLAVRGGHVTNQPFLDLKSSSVLCWNGEAWKIGPEVINGNDSQVISNALLQAIMGQDDISKSNAAVLEVLNNISGPFAFVFLDRIHGQLFFGRDRLGRRSLLSSLTPDSVELSSIADTSRGVWSEVEADAVYVLSLSQGFLAGDTDRYDSGSQIPFPSLQKYEWKFQQGSNVRCLS